MKQLTMLVCCVLFLLSAMWAGDLTGKINFKGDIPKAMRLRMNADPVCVREHKGDAVSEDVVVNKNGTLKNVLVYVKDGLGGKKFDPPKTKAVFDQDGCTYVPHVMGIQVGQVLEVVNSDPTLHNVHSLSKANPQFNFAQPIRGMKTTKTFDKPETFKVKCEVHNWMSAYIGVFAHPYFAVSGDDGSFIIKGLPAGEYTIEAWHEKYGTQTVKVSVPATGSKSIDFSYKGS